MVKAIWAVACPALAGILVLGTAPGCASAPERRGDPVPGAIIEEAVGANTGGATAPAAAYRIGAEDVLHISVWENRELTLDVTVRPDGKISFPLIRDVQAEGLTANELADKIRTGLLDYVQDPLVSVIVTQVNAPKIFVIGNVARPGPYPLRGDMSVLQALSLAGGFTQFASMKSIKVVRSGNGSQEVRRVNYYDMIDTGEGNYILKPGDTIVVP